MINLNIQANILSKPPKKAAKARLMLITRTLYWYTSFLVGQVTFFSSFVEALM